MFACLTLDAIVGLEHNLDAFIRFDGSPAIQFRQIDHWTNIARVCMLGFFSVYYGLIQKQGITFLTSTLLSDGMLVSAKPCYRNRC